MNNYTVKKDAAGEIDILHRNGKPLFCPIKPTMLVPGRLENQMNLHREPCGSWCPFFELNTESNPKRVYLACRDKGFTIAEPSNIQL